MLTSRLGLTPTTRDAWDTLAITETDKLRRSASELLDQPGITGSILYETVCRLHQHHIGLRTYRESSRAPLPTNRDLEMLRLRIVDGASLREIAVTRRLTGERVRQRPHQHFGLAGEPPAAAARRCARSIVAPELERLISTASPDATTA
jgi:hypothetical protein